MNAKVGGLLCFKGNDSYIKVSIDRDVFIMGESVSVRIGLDNSRCSNAIKSMKIKIVRNIEATAYIGGSDEYSQLAKQVKTISELEHDVNVGANQEQEITVEVPIPVLDDFAPKFEEVPEEFKNGGVDSETYPMLAQFSSSFIG